MTTEPAVRAGAERFARILTWNIHRGIGLDMRYDLDRIIDLIKPHDPDIVALQEVDSRGKDQTNLPLTALKQTLGSHAAEARTIVAPDGHYGHVLISRWPMHDINIHELHVSRRETRCAIETTVESPFGYIRVIAAHLGLRPNEIRPQLDVFGPLVRGEPGADPAALPGGLLMMGDFNDWHGRVRSTLTTLIPTHTMQKTFPSWRPILNLDRIYCRPGKALLRSWVDTGARRASDHLPVFAEVDVAAMAMERAPADTIIAHVVAD
ncbi:MAG TPA: endonuclease/exonuclease/phosphatase family protein [Dongiaceae bacterium]|jgi:endonuclease/exonuclease/phosphatase family metal-dependent hydrolase